MKKMFETPVMSVSEFNVENILTTSGMTGVTAATQAQTAINEAAEGREISSTLTFTF